MSLEVVKMKQGMAYSCKEKTIILNVFKYFRRIYSEKCVTEIVRRTAKATGCSEKSVFQFRKEEASSEGFKEPSKTKIRKNININSRFIKYDDNVRKEIRRIIYDLKCQNIVPSLSTILKNVNNNEKLPNFSLMTLRRLLFDMGFCYEKEKNGSKAILVEKPMNDKKENLPADCRKNQSNRNVPTQPVKSLSPNMPKPIVATVPPPNNVNFPQNQMYMPNQSHRALPVPLVHHDNHMMDPIHIPHSMMLNHRMPHQLHHVQSHNMHFKHDMGFMQHGPHQNNIVLQQ